MSNDKVNSDNPQVLLAYKQSKQAEQLIGCLNMVTDCQIDVVIKNSSSNIIQALLEHQFDLILFDVRLLNLKLIEQLHRIRAQKNAASIVLLKQEGDDNILYMGRALGALDIIFTGSVTIGVLGHYIRIASHLSHFTQNRNQVREMLTSDNTTEDIFFYSVHVNENKESTITWISSSFELFSGRSATDFLAKANGLNSLLVEVDDEAQQKWLGTLLQNRPAHYQHQLCDSRGYKHWVETHAEPIYDKKAKRVVSILCRVNDISSQQVLREQQLAQKKQLTLLTKLSRLCNTSAEHTHLIRRIPSLVTMALNCSKCNIYKLENQRYTLVASHGWKKLSLEERTLAADGDNELSFAQAKDDIVIINDTASEKRFQPSRTLQHQNIRSGLCLGFEYNNYRGVLCAYNESTLLPDDNQLLFVTIVTRLITSHAPKLELSVNSALNAPTTPTLRPPQRLSDYINALHDACRIILSATEWQNSIESALHKIGSAYAATHALLFYVETNKKNEHILNLRYEWAGEGQEHLLSRNANTCINPLKSGLDGLVKQLKQGEITLLHGESLRIFSESFTGEQVLLVPVTVENNWWGCFCLLNSGDYEWNNEIADPIRLPAVVLSSAIQKQGIESRMREVIDGTVSKTGELFFASLAEHLAKALRTNYCHIGSIDSQKLSSDILANWNSDRIAKRFTYDLSNSPYIEVIDKKMVYYPENAAQLFADDEWLQAHEIQGLLAVPIKAHSHTVLGYIAIMHNRPLKISKHDIRIITLFAERAAAELERYQMEEENRMLAAMSQENPNPIISYDAQGRLVYQNPACKKLCKKLNSQSIEDALPDNHDNLIAQALKARTTPENPISGEATLPDRALQWFYHAHPAHNRVQLYAIDITKRRVEEEQLRKDAFHDQLTGLPNRGFFKSLVTRAMEKTKRIKGYHYAVLFLDLDRFKVINDSLGHTIGDKFLKIISERLSNSIRPDDYVFRFGGDEFAILLDGISNDKQDATDAAVRLQSELQKPISLGNHEAFTSASIGIALSSRGYENVEDVIRDADSAMYHAKNKGKAQYAVFDSKMHEQAIHILQLESELRHSIDNNELIIHYQPITNAKTDKLSGFEALVRWQHPHRGLLYPDTFVELAEETGFVREIDRWVLDNATKQLLDWKQNIKGCEELSMSLNLSGLHFNSVEILSSLGNLLSKNHELSKSLCLELTEAALMHNSTRALEVLNILHSRGLSISIDDFGVGYSSLTRLRRLPIKSLKIDLSFVKQMHQDQASLDIIRAIIDLAYNLQMEVITKGVESDQQYKLMKRLGSDYMQGYYISKPLPADEATEFIMQSTATHS